MTRLAPAALGRSVVSFELRTAWPTWAADEQRHGWVEEVQAPCRLAFWWASDDQPATRVELALTQEHQGTRLRVVETRPLEQLDLIAIPLPGDGGRTFGPALVAA